jgi:hypothetical protein
MPVRRMSRRQWIRGAMAIGAAAASAATLGANGNANAAAAAMVSRLECVADLNVGRHA